jgi:hypothetical protein
MTKKISKMRMTRMMMMTMRTMMKLLEDELSREQGNLLSHHRAVSHQDQHKIPQSARTR